MDNKSNDILKKTIKGFEQKPAPEHLGTIPKDTLASITPTISSIRLAPHITLSKSAFEIQTTVFAVGKIPKDKLQPCFKDGKELFTYKTPTTEYYLPKEIVDGVMPALASMQTAYSYTLAMAFEQASTNVRFTLGQKLKKMGLEEDKIRKGGAIFQQLINTEKALSHMTLVRTRPDGSRIHGTLCTFIEPPEDKKGRDRIFIVNVNEAFTENMDFKTGRVTGSRIKMLLNLIGNKTMSHYEKNLRTNFQMFIGLKEFAPYGDTLLKFSGLPQSLYKRKAIRDRIYTLAVDILKEMGFVRKKVEYNGCPKDFREWRIYHKPPQPETTSSKKAYIEIGADAEKFIAKFTEWQSRAVHYGRQGSILSPNEIKNMITNTIKGYGLNTCKSIFDEVNRLMQPSPKEFWNRIRTLKKAKNAYK